MKILLLTKNHPVEILDVIQSIHGHFQNTEEVTCISPQGVALMVEEAKGFPYLSVFYPALHQVVTQKEELSSKTKNLIVVGTIDKGSRKWFDVIIGLNTKDIQNYKDFDEDFNTYGYKCMTLKDADIVFETKQELLFFLNRIVRIKNEIQ